jgi:hypothetical protein
MEYIKFVIPSAELSFQVYTMYFYSIVFYGIINNKSFQSMFYLSIHLPVFLSVCLSIYGSTALSWALAAFSVSSFTQSVVLLGRGISPSQGRYLHTQDNTNTE